MPHSGRVLIPCIFTKYWLHVQEYQNATRSSYGVSSLPNGKEYYKACMKWHLSVDKTPEEVHETGLQEVGRISNEMQKVLQRFVYGVTFWHSRYFQSKLHKYSHEFYVDLFV